MSKDDNITTSTLQHQITHHIKPINEQKLNIIHFQNQKNVLYRNEGNKLSTSVSHNINKANSSRMIESVYSGEVVMKK